MRLNDDIQSLRSEVEELHRTLEVTNERLAQLADPPFLHPFHTANRAVSIALFGLVGGPLGKIFDRVMG